MALPTKAPLRRSARLQQRQNSKPSSKIAGTAKGSRHSSPLLADQADEARAFVRNLTVDPNHRLFDKPREFVVPSFYELRSEPQFEADLERLKLKISYDARKSIFTIFPRPGPRHGSVLSWLHEVAISAKLTLHPSVRRGLHFVQNTDFEGFSGEWSGSLKVPDFAVFESNDVDGLVLRTVVEVGRYQSKDRLLEVRDAYFQGAPDLSRFIFINIIEDPKFRCPKDIDIDELKKAKVADFQLDSIQGPLRYMGVQWVGKTTFSWEVWERSSTTGKVRKTFHATLDPQNSESRLPFAKIPATIAADVEAITIKQSDIQTLWNEFLERAIRAEAMRRMVDSVKSADKRTNIAATIAEEKSLQRTR